MSYSIADYRADLARILKAENVSGLPELSKKLQMLLVDPVFASQAFDPTIAVKKRELFHDEVTDTHMYANVHEAGKSGPPHSHGASWAIYGTLSGTTEMTVWKRANPETEDHAELEPIERFLLKPGQARSFGPHVIHSVAQPETSRIIRVTGTDLDTIPRFRFRPLRDKLLESARAG